MELDINYGGVVKSAPLENLIADNLCKITGKVNLQRSQVQVWLNKESTFVSRGLPEFQTRIAVKKPGKSQLIVEARASDLADSVNQATDRMEKRILKDKKGGQGDKRAKRAYKRWASIEESGRSW
jgi:ribosome-associated translation inhibitor RaiA